MQQAEHLDYRIGASVYHTPQSPGEEPVARQSAWSKYYVQNGCLGVVTGAQKAIAVRHPESETSCPSLDL